ncbi:MAG TPA: hypothetical protein VGM50_10045 [Gemmatimonadaceae bacterium]|jgi:hypothetical protein
MTTSWQPHHESIRVTLLRTIGIALVVGVIIAATSGGRVHWWLATILVLWFSFGGHWIELFYLNWLRPRVPAGRAAQFIARLATWLVGGTLLAIGMALTARALTGFATAWSPVLRLGGVAFIGVELIAHLALQWRGRPSFYDGRG